MTTYNRVAGNLVFQTTGNTDTITFTGLTANTATVVIDGDLSVSGNASLTGNIAGDKIFNGTSSIEIPVASGNIVMSVAGVPNVVVVTSTGVTFAGDIAFTGNVSAGNLTTGGIMSAAGNVTGANVIATSNIILSYTSNSTSDRIIRFSDANAAVTTVGANIGAIEWFTSDAAPAARVTAAIRAVYSDASGNANLLFQTANTASATRLAIIGASGNVGVANTAPLHTLAISGTVYGSSTLTAIGNVSGGNLLTNGLISAAGNATAGNVLTTGLMSASGNINAGNVISLGAISAGSGGVSATGNVTGGNLLSQGIISATGNLTTTDIFATSLSASGNVTSGNIITTGAVSAGGLVSATGNVVGGNLIATGFGTNLVQGGILSATGNILGGNVGTLGTVSAAANIVSGSYFIGDGGFLSNITVASNVAVTQLANGVTNWTIRSSTGPITGDINSVANVVIITNDLLTMAGNISATGNVIGARFSTAGTVSATGNIDGGNINATIGNFNTVIGVANASNLTTGTVPSDRLTGIYTINISGYAATVSAAAQPNITSVGNMSSLSVVGNTQTGNLLTGGLVSATGNVTGGNLLTGGLVSATGNVTGGNVLTGGLVSATGNVTGGNVLTGGLVSATGNVTGGNVLTGGLVSATGNVTGNFILGNITFANGYSASKIFNGTSEANIGVANGNATISIDGTSNVVVVANTGVLVSGLVSASGNVTAGNVLTGGLVSATGTITAGNLSVSTGNITGGNLLLSGAVIDSAQLDIQTSASNANIVLTPNGTGNVNIGRMSASGNITAVTYFGSGSGLTSIPNSALTNSSITVNGTAISLGSSATVTANTTNALTIGTGLGGTSFNGGTAVTITNTGVLSLTNGGGITASASSGAVTLGSTATSAATASAIVARDASGDFSANTVTVTNILNGGANGVGNIGNSTGYFNTIFAKATSAQYADLAEKFLADQPYAPGTVLIFGGNNEVTKSLHDADHRVAGVVSTNPSYIMNSALNGPCVVDLALQGRVPCDVIGPVEKGDLLISAPDGRARATKSAQAGTVIGKSIENFTGTFGTIEIVVGRN